MKGIRKSASRSAEARRCFDQGQKEAMRIRRESSAQGLFNMRLCFREVPI